MSLCLCLSVVCVCAVVRVLAIQLTRLGVRPLKRDNSQAERVGRDLGLVRG